MRRRSVIINGLLWTIFDVCITLPVPTLDPALRTGWLCFERAGERRRLAPIPDGWHSFHDDELASLWASAEPSPAG